MKRTDIEHEGVVIDLTSTSVLVRITQHSACSECHAAAMCSTADKKEKIIEVARDDQSIAIGDNVVVVLSASAGYKAVVLTALLPLLLVVAALVIAQFIGLGELQSGTTVLIALVFYYTFLYLCRHRLKTQFIFTLKKQ